MQARRDYEVARTLRRALEQHRRLDFHEFVPVHVPVDRLHDAMSQLERLGHLRPANVQVPVLQPQRLIRLDVIHDLERRRLGLGEDLDLGGHQLHLAGRHPGVLGARGPAGNLAGDADDEFIADVGLGHGSDHDLHRAPTIPYVEEGDTAVVAATSHPAEELDLAPVVGRAERAAVRSVEAAHALVIRAGSSSHGTSVCSPVVISRSCATRRAASSALRSTTQRAPSLFAERIFARRLFGS